MEVDERAQYPCGICKRTIDPTQRVRISLARWYKYTHPSSGWAEWGQMCGACLSSEWRSMNRSWDETTTAWQDSCSHDEWKKKVLHQGDLCAPALPANDTCPTTAFNTP